MELRQLRYFVAVAEELHYGRAARRLHITTPSLSQQVKALESSLGAALLIRDRRHVELTAAGRQLLGDAREILSLADRARAALTGEAAPLRLGYVSWLPESVSEMVGVGLRIDEWVLPSHTQVERVLSGSLDAAVAWLPAPDPRLDLRLLWHEPLTAVGRARQPPKDQAVSAPALTVLVDLDAMTWGSWNDYARAFARDTGCRVIEIHDGGITGPSFFEHCQRTQGPVLCSPKRHGTPMPPTLGMWPVTGPAPLWTWSLATRADDERLAVRRLRSKVSDLSRLAGWDRRPDDSWLPRQNPHR